MNDITISAGAYNVTIYTRRVSDKSTNKLFMITPTQSLSGFTTGTKDTKIVNLLRITREINIVEGYISASPTKTAKEVKQELLIIFNGGYASETATLVYDGESLKGFIESIQVIEESKDLDFDNITYGEDAVRYTVQLNFVVGTLTSG